MLIVDMSNLWIGKVLSENFKVLICAQDMQEASEILRTYMFDSNLEGNFSISEFNDVNTQVDCDYILS